MRRVFADRRDAGEQLGQALAANPALDDVDCVVLGLPRGGVVVAYEVAAALRAPLDVLVVRKLGVPGHEELAFGAVARGGHRVLNPDVVRSAGLGEQQIESLTARELAVAEQREQRYRGHGGHEPLGGRVVVVVDDGVATGATLRVALDVVRQAQPDRIVVGLPVAPPGAVRWLREVADDAVVLESPRDFWAVGQVYRDFGQTSDEEVTRLLAEAAG